jgi:hypothetical protein
MVLTPMRSYNPSWVTRVPAVRSPRRIIRRTIAVVSSAIDRWRMRAFVVETI